MDSQPAPAPRPSPLLPLAIILACLVTLFAFNADWFLLKAVWLRADYPHTVMSVCGSFIVAALLVIAYWRWIPLSDSVFLSFCFALLLFFFVQILGRYALFILGGIAWLLLLCAGPVLLFGSLGFASWAIVHWTAIQQFYRTKIGKVNWLRVFAIVLMIFTSLQILSNSFKNFGLNLSEAITLNDHRYYLTAFYDSSDPTYIQLFECSAEGLFCKQVYDGVAGYGYDDQEIRLVLNPNAASLDITLDGVPLHTYHPATE